MRHALGCGQLAIDGKTLCASADGAKPLAHMISAFATDLGLVLGQEKVADKSNKFTAITLLLDALYVKGFLISIDAMGYQNGRGGACQLADREPDSLDA